MFVPVVRITIKRKMTDSSAFDPAYTLPLYKLKWRGHCTKVTVERITEPNLDKMMKIHHRPDQEPVDAETERLIKAFGIKLFYTVYPGDSFAAAFEKVALEKNEWKDKHDAESKAALKRARQEQRTVVVAD